MEKCSKYFFHFLFCYLDFYNCSLRVLSIFSIQVSYQKYALQIFSPSVACLFILLRTSFREQKFLLLIKSTLSIFSFMDILLVSKGLVPNPRSFRFSLKFSSKSSIVLGLTFSSVICLELIFIIV